MECLFAVASNRPRLLEKNLPDYLSALKGRAGWEVLVCDGSPEPGAAESNRAFLERASTETGVKIRYLPPGSAARASAILSSALSRDVSRLFRENFGGARNLCLLYSIASGRNLVFADDDTTPLYDFFSRYEARFSEGWKLVPGGFEGHVALNAPSLLYAVGESLNELRAGFLGKDEALSRIRLAVRGVPPRMQSHSKNTFVAGNVGISAGLAASIPFLPTGLRVEDALYYVSVASLYGKDARAIFRPQNDQFAYRLTPLSRHERAPSQAPCLHAQLLNELRGSAIVKLIESLGVESFTRAPAFSEDEVSLYLGEAAEASWSDFNMDAHRKNFAESLSLAGESAEREELSRIASLEKQAAAVTLEEAKQALNDYAFALKAWHYVAGAAAEGKVKSELLELSVL